MHLTWQDVGLTLRALSLQWQSSPSQQAPRARGLVDPTRNLKLGLLECAPGLPFKGPQGELIEGQAPPGPALRRQHMQSAPLY